MFGGLAKKIILGIATVSALTAGAAVVSAASVKFMETGGYTSQPIGHYEFCKREAAECAITSRDTRPLKLTNENWQRIVKTNIDVNARIEAKTDMEIYGLEEYWAYPTTVGDCEDYVLLKQRELIKAGISPSVLLITVLRKHDGEGHAVLTLRTDRGDFILDNLTDEILNWQDTDYTYLKRQAANHSGRWVSIESQSNILVGSVRP